MKDKTLRAALAAGIGLGLLGGALQVSADTLLVERAQQAQAAPLPGNGLSMAQVEARFGAPVHRLAPVAGNKPQHPPITRWVYQGFSVYFEHDKVIHSVLDRASARELGPRPPIG